MSRFRGLVGRLRPRRDVVDVVAAGLGRVIAHPTPVPPIGPPDLIDASGPVRAAKRDYDAPRAPEGVLVVRGARLEVRRALDTPEAIAVGRLVAEDGRPLVGVTTLLDVPSAPLGPGAEAGAVLEVDGTLALLDLHGRSAVNYFHWHVDALASRWLVDRVGPGAEGHAGHVVPWGGSDWQRASLASAGMDGPMTLTLEGLAEVRAERFLLPLRSFGSRRVPWWTVEALRTLSPLPAAALTGGPGPRLLYVSRADAPRRRVVGEDRLVGALDRLGFEAVTLEGRDHDAQRRLFHDADVVVAPHGAALTNLAWSRPGCAVVELVPARRPNFAFHRLALEAGATWRGVLCPPDPAGSGAEHDDVVVDVDVVLPVVERALAEGTPTGRP